MVSSAINNAVRLLLVEDDDDLREVLANTLTDNGFVVTAADSANSALTLLSSQHDFNLVLSDINMDGMGGIELLKRIRAIMPHLPVLLMTAYGTIEQAVGAMQLGAVDYVSKPFDADELLNKINTYKYVDASNEDDFIAVDPKMVELKQLARKLAQTEVNILIQGENGTGKEVMARYIHQKSSRNEQAFITVNCAAIPDTMLEATLFGYEKGAFTGAIKSMPGKFEIAQKGTIFLDEIGEIPLNLQAKLLRVIQEKEVERIGSNKVIKLDVRIISASNIDFADAIVNKNFREDLYHRLNVFPIKLPSLNERTEDFALLIDFFLQRHTATGNAKPTITKAALKKIQEYKWTGNIRELENVLQRSLIMCTDNTIDKQSIIF